MSNAKRTVSQVFITESSQTVVNGLRPTNIAFDCVTEFSPEFSQKLTSYPLASGVNITNNVKKDNTTITLVGYISPTPIAATDNNLIDYDDLESRAHRGYQEITDLWKREARLTVVYEYDVFTNMVITSVKPVQFQNSIIFNITLEQARFVQYQRVLLIQDMSEEKAVDAAPNERDSSTGKDEVEDKEWHVVRWYNDLLASVRGDVPDPSISTQ